MKIKILIILSVLYFSAKGIAQPNPNTDSMKYFNIEPYEKLPKDKTTGYRVLSNGDMLDYGSYKTMHFIKIYKYNSPYTYYYEYYPNKLLEFEAKSFYSARVGIKKEYNEKGKLIKETDMDKEYPFSIEALTKKIKEDFNIDILDKKLVSNFNRYNIDKDLYPPLYEVWFSPPPNESGHLTCLFHGITGELLLKDTRYRHDGKKSIVDRYLDILDEKKKSSSTYYKIYKGKKYTQEEWEVYEQELWRKYAKKNNIPIDEKPNSSTGFLLDE